MTETIESAAQDDDRRPSLEARRRPRVHRAWIVAAVTFVTIIGGAAFNSLPGLLIDPLHTEFGWSRGEIGLAVSIDMALYGLTAPFAAALMDRFGIRRVVATALTMVAAGALASVWMTASWQLMIYWGLLVGLGTGSMAMAFAATVTNRWFVARRGLVTGILTAAGASGQLVFLPLCAWIVDEHGWRPASVTVALAALVVVPFVCLLMRDHPADVGLAPYGGAYVAKPAPARGAARRTVKVLFKAARTGPFWLLAGTFAICGASTNGLIRTHFVPSAHDHGMPITAAASLLAVIGIFDVIGTIFSGWLTDRFDARRLLAVYYALRGISLLFLPMLMGPDAAADGLLHRVLRSRLGRHRPADAGALPGAVRRGQRDRLRLGARLAPGGCGGRGVPRRGRAGRLRQLRRGLVRVGGAVRGGGADVAGDPAGPGVLGA